MQKKMVKEEYDKKDTRQIENKNSDGRCKSNCINNNTKREWTKQFNKKQRLSDWISKTKKSNYMLSARDVKI